MSDFSTTSRATKHMEGSLEHKRVGAESKITVSNQSKSIPNKNLSQLDISEQAQNGQRHKIIFHPNPKSAKSFSGRNYRTVLVEQRHIIVSSSQRKTERTSKVIQEDRSRARKVMPRVLISSSQIYLHRRTRNSTEAIAPKSH